jgi:hypothetical protein
MTVTSAIKAGVNGNKGNIVISAEQQDFMSKYEKWMDDFIDVIRVQKISPNNLENNKKLIKLTEIAKAWQPKLTEFMKDDNFAGYYIISTERMTHEIE